MTNRFFAPVSKTGFLTLTLALAVGCSDGLAEFPDPQGALGGAPLSSAGNNSGSAPIEHRGGQSVQALRKEIPLHVDGNIEGVELGRAFVARPGEEPIGDASLLVELRNTGTEARCLADGYGNLLDASGRELGMLYGSFLSSVGGTARERCLGVGEVGYLVGTAFGARYDATASAKVSLREVPMGQLPGAQLAFDGMQQLSATDARVKFRNVGTDVARLSNNPLRWTLFDGDGLPLSTKVAEACDASAGPLDVEMGAEVELCARFNYSGDAAKVGFWVEFSAPGVPQD
jgi:hypothetical protein